MRTQKKLELHERRRWRIRKKITGTAARPRMTVCFTNKHIHVQFIDDETGTTIVSTSTMSKSMPARDTLAANVASAKKVGAVAAQVAQGKGITAVVFDRAGTRYHGKVKALADAAREAGLKF